MHRQSSGSAPSLESGAPPTGAVEGATRDALAGPEAHAPPHPDAADVDNAILQEPPEDAAPDAASERASAASGPDEASLSPDDGSTEASGDDAPESPSPSSLAEALIAMHAAAYPAEAQNAEPTEAQSEEIAEAQHDEPDEAHHDESDGAEPEETAEAQSEEAAEEHPEETAEARSEEAAEAQSEEAAEAQSEEEVAEAQSEEAEAQSEDDAEAESEEAEAQSEEAEAQPDEVAEAQHDAPSALRPATPPAAVARPTAPSSPEAAALGLERPPTPASGGAPLALTFAVPDEEADAGHRGSKHDVPEHEHHFYLTDEDYAQQQAAVVAAEEFDLDPPPRTVPHTHQLRLKRIVNYSMIGAMMLCMVGVGHYLGRSILQGSTRNAAASTNQATLPGAPTTAPLTTPARTSMATPSAAPPSHPPAAATHDPAHKGSRHVPERRRLTRRAFARPRFAVTPRGVTSNAAPPFDVAIIGAGPAGSAAGAWLAGRGRRVVCLERGWFPRHTIGESLLPHCNVLLREAGLFGAVEARNYMPKRGATFVRGDRLERFCFARGLPGDDEATFQVPRDDFDRTLATAARARGVDLRFGHEVETARADEGGATLGVRDVETGERSEIGARFLLDCSGPGRVLAKLWSLDQPSGLPPRNAYFTQVEGDQRPEGELEGDIWVCLHPKGTWLWIIPFSDGRTSVGVVGDDDRFDPAAGERARLFDAIRTEPNAAKRLARAAPVLRTMSLRAWTTKTERTHGPGWALAGNAGDFLDPIFSSGVCLALESSLLAARLTDRVLEGHAVDWGVEFAAPIASAVGVFRSFVEGWYRGDVPKIFFAREKLERVQRQVTSVLGGNVLNTDNPLVRDPEGALRTLLSFVEKLG
jgi:flavin-dependent dehydrogenase